MIPRLKAALGLSELKAALMFSSTDDVNNFEQEFARLADQKYAVAFPYGRTGLVVTLKALGLENAEILCPAYTCVVVPHAIVTSGNTPVFLDSDPKDMNMDLQLVEQAITPKTKAIIATSIFGNPVNLDLLGEIQQRYPDLIVIQDCAHSFFCEWKESPVHKEGLCAIYGLNVSKVMTSIFGGIVTTDDEVFARQLKETRDKLLIPAKPIKSFKRLLYLLAVYPAFSRIGYGLVNRLERSGLLDYFVKYHDPKLIDMPIDYLQAMTPIEARVGIVQCRKYIKIIKHRRKLARAYLDGLKGQSELGLPAWNYGATWSHFVVRTKFAKLLIEVCLNRGVQLGELIDYNIPDLPAYNSYKQHSLGYSSNFPEKVINLPVHISCSIRDAKKIIDIIVKEMDRNKE